MFIEEYSDHYVTPDAAGNKVPQPLLPDSTIWKTKIKDVPSMEVSIYLSGGHWVFHSYVNGSVLYFKNNNEINRGILFKETRTQHELPLRVPPHANAILNLTVWELYNLTPESYREIERTYGH